MMSTQVLLEGATSADFSQVSSGGGGPSEATVWAVRSLLHDLTDDSVNADMAAAEAEARASNTSGGGGGGDGGGGGGIAQVYLGESTSIRAHVHLDECISMCAQVYSDEFFLFLFLFEL